MPAPVILTGAVKEAGQDFIFLPSLSTAKSDDVTVNGDHQTKVLRTEPAHMPTADRIGAQLVGHRQKSDSGRNHPRTA